MHRYLISFDDGSMDHISAEDLPAVGEAAHAVVREAKAAGVWIFGGGILRQQSTIVATDGAVTRGSFPERKAVVGGFSIIEVATHEEAVQWAGRFAKACRCAQEVREIMFDPESI
ncbi:MAG: YciI family protein [Pirellulales bacterium]